MAAIPGPDAFRRRAILGPMALAQLTYRESLRDETCNSRSTRKTPAHMFSGARRWPSQRKGDWRIHAALAPAEVGSHPGGWTLYVDGELLDEVEAIPSTPWTRRPSLCACRSFRLPHHGFKRHEDAHAADLRGNIPRSTSRMALHVGVHADWICSWEAGAITSWIVATSTLPAFMCCTKPGPSSSRVPSRTSMLIASIRRRRIARPASFATRPSPWTASTPVRWLPRKDRLLRSRASDGIGPSPARRCLHPGQPLLARPPRAFLSASKSADRQVELIEFLQADQGSILDQAVGLRPQTQTQDLDCQSRSTPRRRSIRSASDASLDTKSDPLGDPLRENAHTSSTCGRKQMRDFANRHQCQLNPGSRKPDS